MCNIIIFYRSAQYIFYILILRRFITSMDVKKFSFNKRSYVLYRYETSTSPITTTKMKEKDDGLNFSISSRFPTWLMTFDPTASIFSNNLNIVYHVIFLTKVEKLLFDQVNRNRKSSNIKGQDGQTDSTGPFDRNYTSLVPSLSRLTMIALLIFIFSIVTAERQLLVYFKENEDDVARLSTSQFSFIKKKTLWK